MDPRLVLDRLPVAELHRLLAAHQEAQKTNVDIFKAVIGAEQGNGVDVLKTPLLSKAAEECKEELERLKRADDTVNTFRIILNQFIRGRETMHVGELTTELIRQYLKTVSAGSVADVRSKISVLCEFAMSKGWLKTNPVRNLGAMKRDHTEEDPPTLTVEQTRKLLEFLSQPQVTYYEATRANQGGNLGKKGFRTVTQEKVSYKARKMVNVGRAAAWFIITTFCGTRPEEAHKVTKEDINFEEGWIRVRGKQGRRVCYPLPEAMALLQRAIPQSKLPLGDSGRKKIIQRLREVIGYEEWPKDLTRHTATTYWVARADVQDLGKVALQVGNSVQVLKDRYLALATKAQAAEFWQLAQDFQFLRVLPAPAAKAAAA